MARVYKIETFWNAAAITEHAPIEVQIIEEQKQLRIDFSAPFFDNPQSPNAGATPCSVDELWDYEVVEIFFLNSQTKEYFEVELAPAGHWIVLLLRGERNRLVLGLDIEAKAEIDRSTMTWKGSVWIPPALLPKDFDLFNAFALHDSPTTGKRHAESLFPASATDTKLDFHQLKYFKKLPDDVVSAEFRSRCGAKFNEYP